MTSVDLIAGLVILIGVVGIIVPILPGSLLILGAVLFWAFQHDSGAAWVVFAIAAAALVAGNVIKYVVPGRRMKTSGVPNSTLWWGALGAAVGFFVIPVVGLFIGFVIMVYVAERQRVGADDAMASTKEALRAVGVSILIELAAAVIAAGAWLVGVIAL